MPMIDVYAAEGTFRDKHALAKELAAAVMRWEGVPAISLFTNNTAAFVHDLPADSLSNVAGDSNYVRVQVLTPVGVLDRNKQLGVVKELTDIVVAAAGEPKLAERTWVLITESPEGGWGVNGHANTGADIAAAARAELTAIAAKKASGAR
jgi:phenylpyruvate tautomerase PptA (4-oxalocrotonate tautomerase family)